MRFSLPPYTCADNAEVWREKPETLLHDPVDTAKLSVTIDNMDTPTEPANAATRALLTAAIGERLSKLDFDRTREFYPTPEALAARMLETLPDTLVTDPPIGACYSAPALARWKQLSRQAIDQQRKAGRLFGAMVDRRWLYPAAQFDKRGGQSRAFAELLHSHPGQDPVEFAVWLETDDPATGVSPRLELQQAPDTRTPDERFFDDFVPTIIEPPSRRSALRTHSPDRSGTRG